MNAVTLACRETDPQEQLDAAIRTLINEQQEHDGRRLLIVYYSGHGLTLVEKQNELIFAGTYNGWSQTNDKDYKVHQPRADWVPAHLMLRDDCTSDVLLILDCCFASNVLTGFRRCESDRAFEIMVATGWNATTPSPGPGSYTAALIEALRELMQDGLAVSTWLLAQTVMKKHKWQERSNLHPVLLGKEERHIVLAPPLAPPAPASQKISDLMEWTEFKEVN